MYYYQACYNAALMFLHGWKDEQHPSQGVYCQRRKENGGRSLRLVLQGVPLDLILGYRYLIFGLNNVFFKFAFYVYVCSSDEF